LQIIREAAKDSSRVYLTMHAHQRMSTRKITWVQLLRVLRLGRISEGPAREVIKGGWKCTVEHHAAGDSVGVAVAIESIQSTGVTVITVYHITDQGLAMLKYTGCGLRNVWLQNGYTRKKTPYGDAVAIQDVEGLHRVLAKAITRKPKLTGAEFRFIRKELDLSQAALGRMFGFEAQTIALWEKNKQRVPKLADRMLRLIYREHVEDNVKIRELIDRVNDLDRKSHDVAKMIYVDTARGWVSKAAA